ncbi:MAG TPA: DNA methyltransferase, partial [Xanthomonadaceae bacterium]|nr:DNA methyltransferase [Xanthomonadaceae bacterium]
ELMPALRSFLGENDMMAYVVMMTNRLLQLHRVLKPTGSLYLHCDPTASHYLKIVLDGVFGKEFFINEIIWRRYGSHNDHGQGSKHFGRTHDSILFYSKTDARQWNQLFTPLGADYVESTYRGVDPDGRRFRITPLTGPGGAEKGNPVFEWNGHTRAWRYSKETMQRLHDEGRFYYSKTGYVGQKLYLDSSRGVPVQDLWDNISSLSGAHAERMGYPTQKPLVLLERIIEASSNEGDVVLDPFCGCGTAVDAAQKLGRRWIGIDITHLAIALIEKRLKDRYPYLNRSKPEKATALASGVAETVPEYMQTFEVLGTPEDLDGARDLALRDKYQFQWWACSLVNAQPYQGRKKGADGGIDGLIFFQDDNGAAKKIVVSVKGGDNVSVAMLRDFAHVVKRENADIGLFVTLAAPSRPMSTEAVKEGFYASPAGAEFPRIQILTIAGLLDGSERPRYPDLAQGGHTFKKAKLDQGRKPGQDGLF